jgi:hypothetical protein
MKRNGLRNVAKAVLFLEDQVRRQQERLNGKLVQMIAHDWCVHWATDRDR